MACESEIPFAESAADCVIRLSWVIRSKIPEPEPMHTLTLSGPSSDTLGLSNRTNEIGHGVIDCAYPRGTPQHLDPPLARVQDETETSRCQRRCFCHYHVVIPVGHRKVRHTVVMIRLD